MTCEPAPGAHRIYATSLVLKEMNWLIVKEMRNVCLTWPKKRNGKRNVSPLHIQDWNPSAETPNITVTFGTTSHRILPKWLCTTVCDCITDVRQHSNESSHLCSSALMFTTFTLFLQRHNFADGSRVRTIEMTWTKNSLLLTHSEVQLISLS